MNAPSGRPPVVFVNRVYRPSEAATAQLLADLAEALAARGWSVHVVATGDTDGKIAGVEVHRAGPTRPHSGLLAQGANYRAFLAAARQRLEALLGPGDLVVAMTDPPLLAIAAQAAARARGAHAVQWIQDIYPEILPAHAGRWLAPFVAPLRARRDRAWRDSAACVPVSADMGRFVASRGVEAGRIHVLPNWAPHELDARAPAAAVAAQRAAWGVTDAFVVAYSGNLGRVHEFDTALAAAARLRGQRDVVFLFIGDGPRAAEVRAAASRADLANVRFLPPQPRTSLAVSLAAADAHLVTLRPEFGALVSPSKLAGVLAAGRPVLFVGPDGAAAAMVRDAGGAVFAPGDDERLVATIRSWRADPGAVARSGMQARASYARDFTLAGAVARWESLLVAVGRGA